MEPGTIISFAFKILAVIFLVLLNGFFVSSEFALVKLRDTQLTPLIEAGNRRARTARHLLAHLDAYLSAAQLGITLASLGLGWVGEPVFEALLEPIFHWLKVDSAQIRSSLSFAVGFSIITFLHIVAGEMAPKSLAIRQPLTTALWVAYPFRWFYATMKPFIWLLNESSLLLLRLVGVEGVSEHETEHSEEEIRLLFVESGNGADKKSLGREIVLNALDLRHRIVRDVMRPREEITLLDTTATLDECIDEAERTRFSRYPLCDEGDVDLALGVIHVKDLYTMRELGQTGRDLMHRVRPLIYVPETARLEKLLQLFLERKLHMALVVDEYGGTEGLVTLENILEELVGQIQDEFDQEKPLLVQLGPHTWEATGALPLHELEELVGEPVEAEDQTTVNGLIMQKFERFPKVGDEVQLGRWLLRVEVIEGRRVSRLKILETESPEEEESD